MLFKLFLTFFELQMQRKQLYIIGFACSTCDGISTVSKQKQKWGRWNKNYYLRSQQPEVVKRQCCWTDIVKTLDKD